MGTFYPHGKPSSYSYTQHFLDVGHDTAGKAVANTEYPGIGSQSHSIVIKALMNLKSIMNAARAAELAFLRDTGIDLKNPNASNIFRHMNEIFNSKQTFERGLQYMRSIAQSGKNMEKGEMYRDVSRYFGTYLRKTLKTELTGLTGPRILKLSPGQIKSLINQIIGNALVQTYEAVQDFIDTDGSIRGKFGASGKGKSGPSGTEREVQAINDMITAIRKLQSMNVFGNYGHLFDLDVNSLAQMATSRTKRVSINKKKYNSAQVDANFGGNILELITTTIAAEIGNINIANSGLTITGVHTGRMNQMKADSMLFVGRGTINTGDYLKYVNKGLNSVRTQNIDAIDRYLKKLDSNLRHVIMISDKNYSIKAGFKGVNAQEKMNLHDAKSMLYRFGVGDVTALINYLANCGPSMVQGDVNGEVRTQLQTMIGYFLFDHLQVQVSGSSNVNVVNLLNVSGMYIPLSTYLEGIYNSIQKVATNPSSLVSVTISLGGKTEESTWTAGTWSSFRQSHETQSFISYRILKGIADFISGL